jgi:hypothetical protein
MPAPARQFLTAMLLALGLVVLLLGWFLRWLLES